MSIVVMQCYNHRQYIHEMLKVNLSVILVSVTMLSFIMLRVIMSVMLEFGNVKYLYTESH
jgi:hypothetical protein